MRERNKLFPNEKLNYSSFENGRYIISFSPYISTYTFEGILKECYRRSKSKNIKKVKLDLTKVMFFDIFELGLTVLWLLELKNKKEKVEVVFPSPESNAYRFLEEYYFEEFLKKNKISYIKQSKAKDKLYVGFENPDFNPLKFAFETEFQEYLHKLSTEGESEPVLNSVKEFEVVKGGHLRATILKELRDNIQTHANDRLPYFIMTKFVMPKNLMPESDEEKQKKKENFFNIIKYRASYGIPWERPFFNNLLQFYRKGKISNLSYFEIVIGDGGPGIHNVLGKIEESKEKKQYEILDYAFEYDSTSDLKRRLAPAKKWLKDIVKDYDKFPPATGLYQVKQVVKNYSGFLTVRSGKTILCYDFLSYPTYGNPKQGLITNWTWQFEDRRMKHLRKLSSFKGTQYKIFFPVHPIPYLDRRKYFEMPSYELFRRPIFNYVIIPLKKYFSVSENLDTQFKLLQDVFKEIGENIKLLKKVMSLQNRGIVLIDFADITYGILSHKTLHYLICEMMRRQASQVAIVAVNANDKIFSQMEVVRSKVQKIKSREEKSLIVLCENLEVKFLGAAEETQGILENLLKQPIKVNEISENMRRVIDQNHHIINVTEEKYVLSFLYKEVLEELIQNLKKEIKEIILNRSNGIFYPEIRVNIPNRYHVEGFFEIWKLLENSYWRNKLQKWIRLNLRLLNPAVIITIGKPCQKLVESLNIQKIKWISIVNPWDRILFAELITLGREDRIIILTDVLGTGETLMKILNFIFEHKISKILAIVDAREKEPLIKKGEYKYSDHSYKLESIVRQPLNFYIKGKPGDWSYETIKLVEPTTNALIAEPIRPLGAPLWLGKIEPKEYWSEGDKVQDFHNPFIEDVALFSDSIIFGHFTTESKKHMTYFFLVPRIAEYYAPKIAKVIKGHINDVRNKSGRKLNISHILYPEYNPGVEEIVNHISRLTDGKSQPVTNDEIFNVSIERIWDFGEIETVVIFDDSFSSGFTLKRLIDIAYNAGAKFIFAYTLMNRSDYFTVRFLSNLPYYGRVANQIELQIEYLANARIPMFDISDCPICKYIEKLESIRREIIKTSSNYLKNFLDKEIEKWKPIDIESLHEEHILKDYLSIPQRAERCSLRWKLEIAKERIGARNELNRIVKKFSENPQKVLDFLNVLYQEIMYFFEIEKKRYNEVFYFKDTIQEALKFFADKPDILSKNLGAILLVWYFIDVAGLLKCLGNILNSIKENTEVLFEAIGYLLIGENLTDYKYSVNIINILYLLQIKLTRLEDPNPHYELKRIIEYLENKVEQMIPSPLYFNYLLARSGVYYYTYQLNDKIEGYLDRDEKEKAIKSFEEVINEITGKLQGIKAILESNLLTPNEGQKLSENYKKIQQRVDRFNALSVAKSVFEVSKKDLINFIDKFSEAMNCIDDILKVFECDIKKTIGTVLKKEKIKNLMQEYKIGKPEIIINEKAETAFIREDHMERILEELFDNLKHAFSEIEGQCKVKIVSKSISNKFLQLGILDNGKNFPGEKIGGGHFLIRELTEKYGGRFYPLEEIGPQEDFFNEGYRKKSILYIGNILSPQDERIRKWKKRE